MNEFFGLLRETKIKKREFLIQPRDAVTTEYYVLNGCLKAYYMDELGEKHIIQFAIEDWWISDFEAFFNTKPARLYVEAIEDSTVLGIDKEILEILYGRIPKFERFFRIKTTAAFVAGRERILAILEKPAAERYLDFCVTYPDIERRVNNYHIANYLGIKPESLSRIRKQLEIKP
jgi:CRP-like cAMP-binding protein